MERGRLRGGEENKIFLGSVFWILTSQRVCLCVCTIFLTKCNDCVLMGDYACVCASVCVCVCVFVTFMWCVCVCREGVLVLISMYSAVSLTLVRE